MHQLSDWQLDIVERYIAKYPEIVELGVGKVWVEGVEYRDIADDLAADLGLYVYKWYRHLRGISTARGWKVE